MRIFVSFIFCLLAAASAGSQSLSPDAQVSVLTAGPGNELYAVFGHSAIRVTDPATNLDRVYNYGTFDFTTPHFYLKFIRGKLRYRLSVSDMHSFMQPYVTDGRYVYEQILNLDTAQRQAIYDFLETNYQPANRFYAYDFFFDNCSTRIRDALRSALGDDIVFDYRYVTDPESFRGLIDPYLAAKPWADAGIDLGLGLPTDRLAAPFEYMFLPDYLQLALARASVIIDDRRQPLINETRQLQMATYQPVPPVWTPTRTAWLLAAVVILVSIRDWRRSAVTWGLDAVLFSAAGLTGVVLVFLWLGTTHQATRVNLNLLWAMPLHVAVPLLIRYKSVPLVRTYFLATAVLLGALLMSWWLLPQDLNEAFLPVTLALFVRSCLVYHHLVRHVIPAQVREAAR